MGNGWKKSAGLARKRACHGWRGLPLNSAGSLLDNHPHHTTQSRILILESHPIKLSSWIWECPGPGCDHFYRVCQCIEPTQETPQKVRQEKTSSGDTRKAEEEAARQHCLWQMEGSRLNLAAKMNVCDKWKGAAWTWLKRWMWTGPLQGFSYKRFLRFCRTWTKRYLITLQTRVKRVSRIHHRIILVYPANAFDSRLRGDYTGTVKSQIFVRYLISYFWKSAKFNTGWKFIFVLRPSNFNVILFWGPQKYEN